MIWFWIGFFAFVAVLLALDLGVLHKKAETPTLKSATYWTIGWFALGLAFSGFVYVMYANHWLGAYLHVDDLKEVPPGASHGPAAAVMYVSAYLLEYALSVDNIFVISLLFHSFRVPTKYQHRVLFWGIIGAIGFRLSMLAAGAWLADTFDWIFYVFGAYLAFQGFKLMKPEHDEGEANHDKKLAA
jgi:tellurite resistance protein TerC